MNKLQKIFAVFGLIVFVYLLALVVWHTFMINVKYALVCDSDSLLNCKKVEAKYSYDSMDGQFVVRELKIDDSIVRYGPTDCWIASSGSKCMDSSGQKIVESDITIVPLSITTFKAR